MKVYVKTLNDATVVIEHDNRLTCLGIVFTTVNTYGYKDVVAYVGPSDPSGELSEVNRTATDLVISLIDLFLEVKRGEPVPSPSTK